MRDKTCSRNAQKADRTSLLKNPPYKIIPPHLVDSKVGGALLHHLPLHVHLDQARGSDLVVHHPWGESCLKWGTLWDEDTSVLKHESFFYQTGWEESAQCLGWPLLSRGCICPASNIYICTANNIWHPTIRKDNAMKTQQTMCVPNLTPAVDVNESVDCRKFTP